MLKELDLTNTRDALKFLASLGVMKVTASFDGSGDSGQVSDITIEGFAGDAKKVFPPELDGQSLRFFVGEFIDQLLDESGYDWYNDDGGYGEITITPGDPDKPLHIYMHKRFISVQSHKLELDENDNLIAVN